MEGFPPRYPLTSLCTMPSPFWISTRPASVRSRSNQVWWSRPAVGVQSRGRCLCVFLWPASGG